MERYPSPESMEVLFPQEKIVPIHEARHLDTLPDEYEDLWTLITVSMRSTGLSMASIAAEIWQDDSLPQVFRDRALLTVFGSSKTSNELGVAHFNGRIVGRYSYEELTELVDENINSVIDWVDETSAQHTNDTLLSEYTVFHYWLDMFEAGRIDQDKFESKIAETNLLAVLPSHDHGRNQLDSGRFRLLDDIVSGPRAQGFGYETYGGEKVYAWALEQLEKWRQHKNGEQVELHDWCKAVPDSAGIKLYKYLYESKKMGLDQLWPAIQQFGWNSFVGKTHEKGWFTEINTAVQEESASEEMLHSFIHYIFSDPPEPPKHPYDTPLLLKYQSLFEAASTIADKYNDAEILRRIDLESKYIEQYETLVKEHKLEYEEDKQAREIEALNSPEYRAQLAAQNRFRSLLRTVGELANNNQTTR